MKIKTKIVNQLAQISLSVLLVAVIAGSCTKKVSNNDEINPNYSKVPEIKFISLSLGELRYGIQIMQVKFHFQDGDGIANLGLDQNDTLPPFNEPECVNLGTCVNTNSYFFNLRFHIYTLDPDLNQYKIWEFPVNGDTNLFYKRFPRLIPKTRITNDFWDINPTTSYEGEMTYMIPSSAWRYIFSKKTLKFSLSIIDRDLNESNIISTDSIYIQPQ